MLIIHVLSFIIMSLQDEGEIKCFEAETLVDFKDDGQANDSFDK